MSETEKLSGAAVEQAGLADWRLVADRLKTRFMTENFVAGMTLVHRFGQVAEEMHHHPDIDLRYGHVDVSLTSHDVGGLTQRDLDLAQRLSELATDLSVKAAPARAGVLELALDTPDMARIKPFWVAVLGLGPDPDAPSDGAPDADEADESREIVDPDSHLPVLWFQPSEAADEVAQRFHLDVHVPTELAQDRVEQAVAAGGTLVSDEHAPSFWVLADADGNKACVCTWQDED